MIKTDNEDVNYIAECAEAVGIEITDETALSFNLIAKVMRKMRESNEDYISRQAVLDMVEDMTDQFGNKHRVVTEGMISLLPPITSTPKTGHWIIVETLHGEWEGTKKYACDNCGKRVGVFKSNYCPNCGARMVEPQKSEDKE